MTLEQVAILSERLFGPCSQLVSTSASPSLRRASKMGSYFEEAHGKSVYRWSGGGLIRHATTIDLLRIICAETDPQQHQRRSQTVRLA